MQIEIKTPPFTGYDSWDSKRESVVFVKSESDIDVVYEVLCQQDHYWESYKNLIKIAPTEILSVYALRQYCEYCGKCDIYNVPIVKSKLSELGIEILLFQYDEEYV